MSDESWAEAYPSAARQPTLAEMGAFIGAPQWDALRAHLESAYGVSPLAEHSVCSGQPGWNLKYKKSGRSLCTLYPMRGFFIAMVSIGPRDEAEAALLLPSLTAYTQKLYAASRASAMGRWLMLEVRGDDVLEDVYRLIALRTRKKQPE